MNTDLSKSVTCAIGEYLALAKLLKDGHEAFIAQGPTQQGWDIAVITRTEELEKITRVQVKTIDWPREKRRTVTLSNEMAFDYLIVILLDRTKPHSRYLVLSKSEIDALASKENPDRKGKARSWYIAKDFTATDAIGIHENKWEKI